ncbi:hypothetical protein Q8A73_010533 [Channa argus]|nr:hypothetical protein Q8A73_010533 [Channa argus]
MSAFVDAVASRVQTAFTMNQPSGLRATLFHLYLQKFENQFETLDRAQMEDAMGNTSGKKRHMPELDLNLELPPGQTSSLTSSVASSEQATHASYPSSFSLQQGTDERSKVSPVEEAAFCRSHASALLHSHTVHHLLGERRTQLGAITVPVNTSLSWFLEEWCVLTGRDPVGRWSVPVADLFVSAQREELLRAKHTHTHTH